MTSPVVVTGAAGMLGRAVVLAAERRDEPVVALARGDLDVTDAARVADRFRAERPRLVVHCAAWTDVDEAEAHSDDAMRVNRDGTAAVCRAAAEVDAAVVVLSSDYVFNGEKGGPYVEDDGPAPVNVYGHTKWAAEIAARDAFPDGARIARTAWLYGSGGANFVDTIRSLARERSEVAVVADQTGSPTWVEDLAEALLELPNHPPGTYHLACSGAVTWAELAERIVSHVAPDCQIRRTTTAEFARPAPRPRYSALASTVPSSPLLGSWDDALLRYLNS